MTNTLVILGSARGDGDTIAAVKNVVCENKTELINLLDYNISPYDYENKNADDDFIKLAEKMVVTDKIIFATPVYWYAMSAQLKTFFDRFTDLITIRKEVGRKLKGKKCYVISCGSATNLPVGFEEPFSETCNYLDMEYKGCLYCYTGKDKDEKNKMPEKVKSFSKKIFGG